MVHKTWGFSVHAVVLVLYISQAWKDLSEKLSKRVLQFNQGCFNFNFMQFKVKVSSETR